MLCPGVFGFFIDAQERPQALLAVHVDDVRLVVSPEAQDDIKGLGLPLQLWRPAEVCAMDEVLWTF